MNITDGAWYCNGGESSLPLFSRVCIQKTRLQLGIYIGENMDCSCQYCIKQGCNLQPEIYIVEKMDRNCKYCFLV